MKKLTARAKILILITLQFYIVASAQIKHIENVKSIRTISNQVVLKYTTTIEIENPDVQLSEILVPSLFSLVLVLSLGYFFWKFNTNRNALENEKNKIRNE